MGREEGAGLMLGESANVPCISGCMPLVIPLPGGRLGPIMGTLAVAGGCSSLSAASAECSCPDFCPACSSDMDSTGQYSVSHRVSCGTIVNNIRCCIAAFRRLSSQCCTCPFNEGSLSTISPSSSSDSPT